MNLFILYQIPIHCYTSNEKKGDKERRRKEESMEYEGRQEGGNISREKTEQIREEEEKEQR